MTTHTRPSRRADLAPGALRRARQRAGLSIAMLATASGVSYSHLSDVEVGRRNTGISVPALARVADALGVSIASLLREEEPVHGTPQAG
jgi:transcriptional regulator with XRE-family HTH domain